MQYEECTCYHTKDRHAGMLQHGYCTVPGCKCQKFTWARMLGKTTSKTDVTVPEKYD